MRGRNALPVIGGVRGTLLIAACWEFLEDELETCCVLGRNNPRNPCLTWFFASLNRRVISWEVRDKVSFCRARTPYRWQSPRWQADIARQVEGWQAICKTTGPFARPHLIIVDHRMISHAFASVESTSDWRVGVVMSLVLLRTVFWVLTSSSKR